MSIANEIQRLNTAKADIKTAIEAKGVTVPSSATIDTYDDYVSQISGGGDTTTIAKLIDRSITSIEIPSGVTKLGYGIFRQCYSLTSVTMPNSVIEIDGEAFEYCRGLTSIDIPSGVTIINNYAFYYCSSLTSITIPDNIGVIAQYAFAGCNNLTSITINAATPPTLSNANAFNDTNNCPIYVPAESVETYKTASNWSTYASRIQAIPSE